MKLSNSTKSLSFDTLQIVSFIVYLLVVPHHLLRVFIVIYIGSFFFHRIFFHVSSLRSVGYYFSVGYFPGCTIMLVLHILCQSVLLSDMAKLCVLLWFCPDMIRPPCNVS